MQTTDVEAIIRTELERLDTISGFHAASSIVLCFDATADIIRYIHYQNDELFIIPVPYLLNNEMEKDCILKNLQHEYAHYLAYHIYGYDGHGKMYNQCCKMIGI